MSKHELSLVEVTHYTDPEVLAIVKDFHVRGNFDPTHVIWTQV